MFQVRSFESRTVTWWYQRRDSIDTAPPFQRSGKLWTTEDKAFLIDSIINEYDIPKLYLADFSYSSNNLNKAGKQFAVIDGRQRLEAIFEFIQDKFPLSEAFIYERDKSENVAGKRFSEIKRDLPHIIGYFEQFNLPVMSVITDDEAKINQLFVRLNRNKPLTGAEIRNAMSGIVPEAIREIAGHEFFTDRCAFSTSRGQDKNTAAKLLLLSHTNQFVSTKKYDLDSFAKKYTEVGAGVEVAHGIAEATRKTRALLDELCNEYGSKDKRLSSSGLIPVIFKLADVHGANQVASFFSLWTRLTKIDQDLLVNELSAETLVRLNTFTVLRRNVNDSFGLQRVFAALSMELNLYRLGRYSGLEESLPRLQLKARARMQARKGGGVRP